MIRKLTVVAAVAAFSTPAFAQTFVTDTISGTPGFGTVIDSGPGRFDSTNIGANLDALHAYADGMGCDATEWAGTWVRGRSPRLQGETEDGGTITGPNITNGTVDGVAPFSASLASGGMVVGSTDGGNELVGHFARLNSKRSIWYAVEIDCDGGPPADPPEPQGLQNATAIFSQSSYSVAETLDGNTTATSGNGWASWTGSTVVSPNTAVWETTTDAPTFAGGTTVEVSLIQSYVTDHNLGCMELYVTGEDRSEFADGQANAGQIGLPGIWSPLFITDTQSNGTPFTVTASTGRVVASDVNLSGETYVITGTTSIENVTGIRLDMCDDADPSLIPTGGPGLASNRNFVLTEIQAALGGI